MASRIHILGATALALDRGAVYLDSGAPGRPAAPLAVRTPFGEVEETGTQFEVRLGPGPEESVRIRVREGSVVLRAAGRVHTVGALTELAADGRGGRGGARSRVPARSGAGPPASPRCPTSRASRRGPSWIGMAREGGWRLGFADDETARLAAATVLRGSVEGLTVEQALDAVLPTCGMVHRIEDGRLIVARAAS